MTQETFLVTDFKDIHSLRMNCKCGAYVAFNPDMNFRIEPRCHQCGEDLMDANTHSMIGNFMNYLRQVRTLKSEKLSLALVFRRETETS